MKLINQTVSAWAQVGTLLILIFGYFYTVVPVFQKEKLSEDVARLRLEQSTWQEQIARNQLQIDDLEGSLNELKRAKSSLEASIDELIAEKTRFSKDLASALAEKENLLADLEAMNLRVEEASEKLYESKKLAIMGDVPLTPSFVKILTHYQSKLDEFSMHPPDYMRDLAETGVQPIRYVEEDIESFKTSISTITDPIDKQVSNRLLDEMEANFEKKRSLLTCPEPEMEAWESIYEKSLTLIEVYAQRCTDENFQERIEDEGWSESQIVELKKSDWWPQQHDAYERSCRAGVRFAIEKALYDKWNTSNLECQSRAMRGMSILLKDEEELDLKPLQPFTPPTIQELISILERSD